MQGELISEPLEPVPGTFDTVRMSQGLPGLPSGFTWRGTMRQIAEELQSWKDSQREGGSGELYLRRHYHRLRMDDGTVWTIYFTRQTPKSGSPKKRWFLYTIEPTQEGKAC